MDIFEAIDNNDIDCIKNIVNCTPRALLTVSIPDMLNPLEYCIQSGSVEAMRIVYTSNMFDINMVGIHDIGPPLVIAIKLNKLEHAKVIIREFRAAVVARIYELKLN